MTPTKEQQVTLPAKYTTAELREQASRTPDWNAQPMLIWAADVIDAAQAMADEYAKAAPKGEGK